MTLSVFLRTGLTLLGAWLAAPQRAGTPLAQWAAQRYGQRAVARQAIEIYQQILQTRSHTPPLP